MSLFFTLMRQNKLLDILPNPHFCPNWLKPLLHVSVSYPLTSDAAGEHVAMLP